MTWIKIISDKEATGELKEIYDKIKNQRSEELASGPPLRPYMLHSLNPKAMLYLSQFRHQLFCEKSNLTTAQRKMISTVTSALINCEFCKLTHAEFLRNDTQNDQLVEQLKINWRKAPINDKEYAMLEYVEKLTLNPGSMTKSDLTNLQKVGWEEPDILDIVQLIGYMNLRTRVVNALGMEPSDWQLTRSNAGKKRLKSKKS